MSIALIMVKDCQIDMVDGVIPAWRTVEGTVLLKPSKHTIIFSHMILVSSDQERKQNGYEIFFQSTLNSYSMMLIIYDCAGAPTAPTKANIAPSEPTNKAQLIIDAARNGHIGVVQELLDKGADVNAKDNKNRTALMLAFENGHKEIMELLMRAGATKEPPRGSQRSSAVAARQRGQGWFSNRGFSR